MFENQTFSVRFTKGSGCGLGSRNCGNLDATNNLATEGPLHGQAHSLGRTEGPLHGQAHTEGALHGQAHSPGRTEGPLLGQAHSPTLCTVATLRGLSSLRKMGPNSRKLGPSLYIFDVLSLRKLGPNS